MGISLRKMANTATFFGQYLLITTRIPCLVTSENVGRGFCSTHLSINKEARKMLARDGLQREADISNVFQKELDTGNAWADSGWGSIHHFYNPKTKTGILRRAPANLVFQHYYEKALAAAAKGRLRKAFFLLGAATHLLQDLCQPYHARCSYGSAHSLYEKWVQNKKDAYLTGNSSTSGLYQGFTQPVDWLHYAAKTSYDLFDLVQEGSGERGYHYATSHLLPFAERITAGFWADFLRNVERSGRVLSLDAKPRTGGLEAAGHSAFGLVEGAVFSTRNT